MLWKKADSVLLINFREYSKNPLVNKYLPNEASENYEGLLLLRKNKKPLWISHPFNYKQAKKEFATHAQVATYNTRKELQKLLKKNCGRIVGFDSSFTSVAWLKTLRKLLKGKKLVDVSVELGESREIKEKNEVAKIVHAVKATKEALTQAKKTLKKGVSEKEVANSIVDWLKRKGFGTDFCIVAFGENTSHIHHAPSPAKKLSFNSPVLIDCGAKYKGYVADITQTFWFGEEKGKAYEEFEGEKEKVQKCLNAVESKLKAETPVKLLWKETKVLGKMPHALGHGIGVEGHDHPNGMGENAKWKLKEGMVLAVEPAIYVEGKFGVRIENDYLITKKGFRKL